MGRGIVLVCDLLIMIWNALPVGVTWGFVSIVVCYFFFFQAEDGIRDLTVTGVQTCALPICWVLPCRFAMAASRLSVLQPARTAARSAPRQCHRRLAAGDKEEALTHDTTDKAGSHPRRTQRCARGRDGAIDRRAVLRQDAGRVRRRRGQDRGAGRGRSAAQLAPDQERHLGLVAGAVAQQALGGAGPAPAGDRKSVV